ncbi:conserved hypothetical protein [Sporisorium reilianum SRZ2]|uniref:Uncharacterized protein n=1 Tax=Sporisorium reilianum (strain SRZ2) TaxID=999809 RepID=E6ZVC7_SPORE|nr:conserved hypothetical protein [Sporisorium reilianum SRZ2]
MTDICTEGIFSGLALWLVPSAHSAFGEVVRGEMGRLRAANAGGCSGEFGVHATLLAGLGDRSVSGEALRDVAREAVRMWRAQQHREGEGLTVALQDVTTRGTYFQCILIALAHSPTLLALHHTTRHLVDLHFPPTAAKAEAFFPHISLLYAPLDAAAAQTQIDKMQQQGVFEKTHDGISFHGFTEAQFGSVDVYDCTGRPEQWVKLHSVPL